jgi:hypothetical protein
MIRSPSSKEILILALFIREMYAFDAREAFIV